MVDPSQLHGPLAVDPVVSNTPEQMGPRLGSLWLCSFDSAAFSTLAR